MEKILQNIEKIRKIKGYSQEYMADMIGIAQANYSLIERGNRELKYKTLCKIAEILGYKVTDIITYPNILNQKSDNNVTIQEPAVSYVNKDREIQLLEKEVKLLEKVIYNYEKQLELLTKTKTQ